MLRKRKIPITEAAAGTTDVWVVTLLTPSVFNLELADDDGLKLANVSVIPVDLSADEK